MEADNQPHVDWMVIITQILDFTIHESGIFFGMKEDPLPPFLSIGINSKKSSKQTGHVIITVITIVTMKITIKRIILRIYQQKQK